MRLPSLLFLASFGLAVATPVSAAPILTSTYETQLETWFNQGDLTFTKIFAKEDVPGATGEDFHAAADGQGPTILLMNVFGNWPQVESYNSNLPLQTIGAFNPISFRSEEGATMNTYDNTGRTSFLFNLTYDVMQMQNQLGEGITGSGTVQTQSYPNFGPIFGAGSLMAGIEGLQYGRSFSYDFGGASYPVGQTITRGGSDPYGYEDTFEIAEFEIYTVSAVSGLPLNGTSGSFTFSPGGGGNGNVPDTGATLTLLALALGGLAATKRRT